MSTSTAAVREYLQTSATTGQFTDGFIGSNIRVATAQLQRVTNRQFEAQTATKVFTTRGRASLTIPDLLTATAVTLNGSALVANSSYYLIPDAQNTGVFTAIDLPQYRFPFDYRSYSDWFDKGYDNPLFQARLRSGIPNDLSIAGSWGHTGAVDEFDFAVKVQAAWLTKRPDAVLSNTLQTPEGNILDLSRIPPEVQQFISGWRIDLDTVASL